jgi:hypothetical protein
VENKVPFSAVSVVHYRFYTDKQEIIAELAASDDVQCTVGHNATPFGQSQKPSLTDYADGVDTMSFLENL